MIQSFGNKATEDFFHGRPNRANDSVPEKAAARKLSYIHAAAKLDDLNVLPGNRLEKLKGNLAGFYSIRINDQWRIVFRFDSGNAVEVRICDYH